jgi:Domain of unknown function (DUF4333)
MRPYQLTVGALLAFVLGGCNAKVTVHSHGVGQVSHQVEQSISNKLAEQRGVRPKSVACPQSMEPKKGNVYRCTLTAPNGDTVGVTVTMQGGANFHFEVDQRVGRRARSGF